jgi:hypothetical protein
MYIYIYIYIYICTYVVVQRNPGNFLIQYCVSNNVGCILLRVVMLVLLLICRAVLLPSLLGKISLRATHRVTSCRCIRIAYVLGLKLLLSMYTYKKKRNALNCCLVNAYTYPGKLIYNYKLPCFVFCLLQIYI